MANDPDSPSANFEPFILPVFIVFLFACSMIIYVEIVQASSCTNDTIASSLLFFSVLSYLAWRAVRNSDVRQQESTASHRKLLWSWFFLAICFVPSLLIISHSIQNCGDHPAIEVAYYNTAVLIAVAIFLLGVVGSFSIANSASSTESLSKHILIPGMLISLFLSLGSAHFFGYLANYLSPQLLDMVLDVRYVILALAVVLVLIDAFLLSESLSAIWGRVQAIAEKWFRIRPVNLGSQNLLVVFGLSVLNIIVGLARYIFQGVATIGLAAVDFIISLAVALTRFAVGGGTIYGIALSAAMIGSAWMTLHALSVADQVRALMRGANTDVEWYFALFALYYLAICLAHALLCRSKDGRFTVTLDSAAKIGGLATLGAWISCILLHSVASITSFGTLLRLNAPGFEGWTSLGLFFWTVFAIAVCGSAFALFWLSSSDELGSATRK